MAGLLGVEEVTVGFGAAGLGGGLAAGLVAAVLGALGFGELAGGVVGGDFGVCGAEGASSIGLRWRAKSSSSGSTLTIPPHELQTPCCPAHSMPTSKRLRQCGQVMRIAIVSDLTRSSGHLTLSVDAQLSCHAPLERSIQFVIRSRDFPISTTARGE